MRSERHEHQGICTVLLCLILMPGCSAQRPWSLNPFDKLSADREQGPPPMRPVRLTPQKSAEICLATADEMEGAGRDAEAAALLEKVRQYDPKQKDLSHRLARLYDRSGDTLLAQQEFEKAVARNPHSADVLNDFGYFYYEREDWGRAEEQFRKALVADPNNSRAWGNLAMVLAQREQYQDSFDAFCRVVSPAEAHSNLGVLLTKQGRPEEAAAQFRAALELNPSLPQARIVASWVEQHPDSEQMARRATDPQSY